MKTIWLYLCIAAGLVLAGWGLSPPVPVPQNAPLSAFSAVRAMKDIRVVGKKSHPVGSEAHDATRDYILKRLSALGMQPSVYHAVAVSQRFSGYARAAQVDDIVAVMKGTDHNAPAVAVMAHYDTVPHSPGAADDTAGVASVLEIARALKYDVGTSGRRPVRDVIFLITDGEEAGLLGAEAFYRGHPLARHIGMVLNFETRGDSGPAEMFETHGSDALIRHFAAFARYPAALSAASAIYNKMPNGTDFSVSRSKNIPGLNFAFIGNEIAYHSAVATPDHLNPASVQQMGSEALPVVRDLAYADTLPAAGPETRLIYADIFGRVLIHYTPLTGWALLLLSLVLVMLVFLAGQACVPRHIVRGFFASLWLVSLSALVLMPLQALVLCFGHFQLTPRFPLFLAGALVLVLAAVSLAVRTLISGSGRLLWGLGVVALAGISILPVGGMVHVVLITTGLAFFTLILGWCVTGSPLEMTDLWRGSLIFGFMVCLLMQIFMPSATPLVLWPMLLAGISGVLTFRYVWHQLLPTSGLLVCGLLAVFALALAGYACGLLFTALGLSLPAVMVLPVIALLPVCMPLLASAGQGRTLSVFGMVLLLTGACLVAAIRIWPPDARFPMPVEISRAQDNVTGQAWLFSSMRYLDPWSREILTGTGEPLQYGPIETLSPDARWYVPVMPASLAAPGVQLKRDHGRVAMLVRPGAGVAELELQIRPSVALSGSRLFGQPLRGDIPAGKWTRVHVYVPGNMVAWSFMAPAHAQISVRVTGIHRGWPADAPVLAGLPDGYYGFGLHGDTLVSTEKQLRW